MKFILGKKMSMTQLWVNDKVFAVTPVAAGPCVITQVKDKAKDGYEAIQLAYGDRKEKNINKPQRGHYKAAGVKPAHAREFRFEGVSEFKVGDVVSSGAFAVGDIVSATGTSKGRGFQGVVKRHHFKGFRATHGNKDQERMGGSVGPKGPAHVFKGTRMGGRMGGERVTTTNLEIMDIDEENNILYVKGAVPGAINGLIMLKAKGNLVVNLKKAVEEVVTPVEEVVAEEVAETTPAAEVVTPVEEVVVEVATPAEEVKAEEAPAEVKAE